MRVKSAHIEKLEKDKPNGKCRKWRLWVSTEEEGRKSRRFSGTYSMAEKAVKEFKAELEGIIPNAETFAAYAEARVKERATSNTITANTIATETRYLRAVERSPLGSMKMDAIKPKDCREALTWIRANPQRPNLMRGEELSNTTMHYIYRFCRQTFQQAVDDELLAKNPMAKIKNPKFDTPEVDALSWNQMMALLDWLDTLPLSAFVMAMYLIACLALRRAEACAVLDAEVWPTLVHISQAVKESDGTVGLPKSEAGIRDLPVMPRLATKIKQWRRFKKSKGLGDAPTLACNVQGGVLRPQNLYRWWRETTKDTEFEGVRLHQLRHSNLTHMARHMSAFDLMHYAGWSSLEPTRVYIHDDYSALHRGVCDAWGVDSKKLIKKVA